MTDRLRSVLLVGAVLAGSALSAPLEAANLEVFPPVQASPVGEPVEVDVRVSGLGNFTSPAVGAFDLSLGFDPGVVSFSDLTFGPLLGDATGGEAVTTIVPAGAELEALEVSVLLPPELIALQPSSFTLFTARFDGVGPGKAPVELQVNDPLSDELGDPLPTNATGGEIEVVSQDIPTLGTWSLILLALLLAGLGLQLTRT